jgi:hypothetical protein
MLVTSAHYSRLTLLCEPYVTSWLFFVDMTLATRFPKQDCLELMLMRVQERLALTDVYIERTLRTQDAAQGKWLNEDPTLAQIQHILVSRQ